MVLLGPHTITIGGVDVTELVDATTLQINNQITRAVDTCSFVLYDFDGTLSAGSFDPLEDELVITDSNGARLFGGIIKKAQLDTSLYAGEWRESWDISASDYTDTLLRTFVLGTYEDMTDAGIIQDFIAEYYPTIDATTYVVSSGITYERFIVNRMKGVEVLDKLADASGYDWYVDPDANLHYFPLETNVAPFGISTSPDYTTTQPAVNLQYEIDTSELCNTITVAGGQILGSDETFILPSQWSGYAFSPDGLDPDDPWQLLPRLFFNIPTVLYPADGEDTVLVYVNTGDDTTPVWDQYTVYPDNNYPVKIQADTAAKWLALPDYPHIVFHNKDKKTLRFVIPQSADLDQLIKVVGRFEIPLLVRVRSYPSYDRYGKWYEDKIVENTLRDQDQAIQLARSTLASRSFAQERLSFVTYEHGLRAGQTIHVTDSGKGIDADFLVQSVKLSYLGGPDGAEVIRYTVNAGANNPDLVALLLDIRRRQFQEDDTVQNQFLTEILDFRDTLSLSGVFTVEDNPAPLDTLSLSEAYSVTANTGPYRYSASEATPDADLFRWEQARWA